MQYNNNNRLCVPCADGRASDQTLHSGVATGLGLDSPRLLQSAADRAPNHIPTHITLYITTCFSVRTLFVTLMTPVILLLWMVAGIGADLPVSHDHHDVQNCPRVTITGFISLIQLPNQGMASFLCPSPPPPSAHCHGLGRACCWRRRIVITHFMNPQLFVLNRRLCTLVHPVASAPDTVGTCNNSNLNSPDPVATLAYICRRGRKGSTRGSTPK